MKINGFHILDAPVVSQDSSQLFRIVDGKLVMENLRKDWSSYRSWQTPSGLEIINGSEFKQNYDRNGDGRLDILQQKLLIIDVPECIPH